MSQSEWNDYYDDWAAWSDDLPYDDIDNPVWTSSAGSSNKMFAPLRLVGNVLLSLTERLNEFALDWRFSRELHVLLRGMPVLVGFAAVLFVCFSISDSFMTTTRERYELALSDAIDDGDTARQSMLINTLLDLSPEDPRYKYQLAILRIDQGRPLVGQQIMESLAPLDEPGYANAHLWIAQQLLRQEDNAGAKATDLAVRHLKAALARDSHLHNARRLLGITYASQDKWPLAKAYLSDEVSRSPDLHLTLAIAEGHLGNIDEKRRHAELAEAYSRELVEQDAGDVPSWISWSESLRLRDSWPAAELVLREGLEATGDVRLRKALSRLYSGRARELAVQEAPTREIEPLLEQSLQWDPEDKLAIETALSLTLRRGASLGPMIMEAVCSHFESRLSSDADQPLLRYRLGQVFRAMGRAEKAAEQFAIAAESDPRILLPLAQLYQASGRSVEAQEAARGAQQFLSALLEQDSDDLAARLALCDALVVLQDWDAAEKVLDQDRRNEDAGAIRASRLRLLLTRFDATLRTEGEATAAFGILKQAVQVAPADEGVVLRLAALARRDSGHDEARGLLESLLSQGIARPQIHMVLGTIATEDGDFSLARMHLEEAHRLDSEDAFIANNLAWLLATQPAPDLDRALTMSNVAVAAMPDDAGIRRTRSQILIRMGHWEAAIHELESLLAMGRQEGEIHRDLAEAYEALGGVSLAAKHRRLAIARK